MDIGRVEELLERYWLCETTVSEEEELCSLFAQEDLPEHLLKYKQLFVFRLEESTASLNEQFDKRILEIISKSVPEEKREKRLWNIFRPHLQVAASIAVVLILSFSVYLYHQQNDPWKQETYDNPEQALAEIQKIFSDVSEKIERGQEIVSVQMEKVEPMTQIIRPSSNWQ